MDTNYYIISRRYICHACEAATLQIKTAAQSDGLQIEDKNETPQYAFMGYDIRSRQRLLAAKRREQLGASVPFNVVCVDHTEAAHAN